MAESPTQSPQTTISSSSSTNVPPQIPIEIVTEEEMALIEAAFASARTSLSTSLSTTARFRRNARSIQSITLLSKRGLSGSVETSSVGDIEDSVGVCRNAQKRNRVNESLLHRFRRKRGLSVTDITSTVMFLSLFKCGFCSFSDFKKWVVSVYLVLVMGGCVCGFVFLHWPKY